MNTIVYVGMDVHKGSKKELPSAPEAEGMELTSKKTGKRGFENKLRTAAGQYQETSPGAAR